MPAHSRGIKSDWRRNIPTIIIVDARLNNNPPPHKKTVLFFHFNVFSGISFSYETFVEIMARWGHRPVFAILPASSFSGHNRSVA